jgi:hypothetical protein
MTTPQDSRHHQPPAKDNRRVKNSLAKGTKPSTQQLVRRSSMANSPQRTHPKPSKPKTRWQGCLVTLGAISLLLASGGVIIGGIWLGVLLMINPNAVVWLNQFLPQWTRIPISAASSPKSLETIQADIRKSGLMPGEPLYLSKNGIDEGSTALLLPIFKSPPNCQIDCQQLFELRVYQPTTPKYYQLATRLAIAEPEEYFVLSSLQDHNAEQASTSRTLPLTQIERFSDNAPESGFWFNLSDQQPSGDTPMTYGQVVHYNPGQLHLSVMLQWTTPNEQLPYWQQITGNSTPELVINQTVGLEPNFKVHQLQPRNFVPNPIALEEISLVQPALNTERFRNALLLVRHGLWSPAVTLLQSQKKSKWSTSAQAQLDVIQLHAQVTQAQAKQAWASPNSSILTHLMDGRWADALLVFRSAVPGPQAQEIITLLKNDSGELWDRVETALKVFPDDNEIKAWGALILSVQQGRLKAIAWLEELAKTQPVNSSEISELLDRLDVVLAQLLPTRNHSSRVIGTARPVLNVNPTDWLQLEPPAPEASGTFTDDSATPLGSPTPTPSQGLQLEPLQVWYQVQVSAFHDGQRWWRAPFSNLSLPQQSISANQLWNYLGLDTDAKIQITLWSAEGRQEATTATVKGVSFQGGVLQLLAAGEVLPTFTTSPDAAINSRLLAHTDAALRWIDPIPVTLSDLNQVQSGWVSALLPTLRRELEKSGQYPSSAALNQEASLEAMGNWSVRLVELTGNNQPDAVLTLYQDFFGGLKPETILPTPGDSPLYQPRTLIFSDAGTLLYSEFSQNANTSLTGIADLGDGGPAGLLLSSKTNYTLKRWSSKNQRFE